MNEPDPLDETLELARATLAPSLDDDARLRRALGLTPLGPLPPSVRARAAAARPRVLDVQAWRALRASGSAGVLVGAVLAGIGFGAGLWLGPAGGRPVPAPPESASPPSEPAGVRVAGEEPRRPAFPEVPSRDASPPQHEHAGPAESSRLPSEPIARRRARVPTGPASATSRARAPSSSAASEELALLRRVERALRAENPALALALIAELDRRFPDTRLAEERDAAHVIAACGIGEGGARLRAERFLREHGGSVYAERAREACGIPEGSAGGEGSSGHGDQ